MKRTYKATKNMNYNIDNKYIEMNNLPHDILAIICAYTGIKNRTNLSLVSHKFNSATNSITYLR